MRFFVYFNYSGYIADRWQSCSHNFLSMESAMQASDPDVIVLIYAVLVHSLCPTVSPLTWREANKCSGVLASLFF